MSSTIGIRGGYLEFQEQRFCIGIIFLFTQIENLSFPPIPGLHLNQLIEPWIAHHNTATIRTLKTGKRLTSLVHTAVSIIDYTTSQG